MTGRPVREPELELQSDEVDTLSLVLSVSSALLTLITLRPVTSSVRLGSAVVTVPSKKVTLMVSASVMAAAGTAI